MYLIFLGLFGVVAVGAQHGHGHGGGYVTSSPQLIDSELQGLYVHFGSHLCLDLLMVDCSSHPISGDEIICGSDGLEYANHCKFVHAACMFESLTIRNHGSCKVTTAPPATTAAPVVTTAAQVATNAPVVTTAAPAGGSTAAPAASTAAPTAAPTTTLAPTTTTAAPTIDPAFAIIKDVFCTNKDGINCLGAIEFICGSDGTLYPNSCEFSKARCDDNFLNKQDLANCPGAPTTAAATTGAAATTVAAASVSP